VGTFVVEDLDKFFEARLLLKKISGGRLGGLFLQGQMHALMTPIGLSIQMRRIATLRVNVSE
jgi:hypothetical protein